MLKHTVLTSITYTGYNLRLKRTYQSSEHDTRKRRVSCISIHTRLKFVDTRYIHENFWNFRVELYITFPVELMKYSCVIILKYLLTVY